MGKHGFVHVEISANDLTAASSFYQQVFNWTVQAMPEMNYALFETGTGPGGGFSPVVPENPAGTVMVYVETDNIEDTLAKVEKAGGKTLQPRTEIPGMGWFAQFKDPTGNILGIFQELPGGDAPPG